MPQVNKGGTYNSSCTFGPNMSKNFQSDRFVQFSMYLTFIPLVFSVLLLAKAYEGTRYLFVYEIAVLTMLGCLGDAVFDAVFVCQTKIPLNKDGSTNWQWRKVYEIFEWSSNLQNYVSFVFLHLW